MGMCWWCGPDGPGGNRTLRRGRGGGAVVTIPEASKLLKQRELNASMASAREMIVLSNVLQCCSLMACNIRSSAAMLDASLTALFQKHSGMTKYGLSLAFFLQQTGAPRTVPR